MKRISLILLVLALMVPLMAVNAFDNTANPMPANSQEDGMEMSIQFAATVGDDMVMCGMEYAGVGAAENTTEITDFRFYVHDIMLIDADGNEVPFELEQDGKWQFENVALLDFEDGSGRCEFGTASVNTKIEGSAPHGDYVGLAFKLGVPFELNHAEPTSSPSPLNLPSLWWNWQIGYKFVRIDLLTDAEEEPGYNIHLGSTGCESVASAIAPAEPCSRPNIVSVTMPEFDLASDVVLVDLLDFLAIVDLSANVPAPGGCQAGPTDPDCETVLPSFGLDLETGVCAEEGCASQAFFQVASAEDTPLLEDMDMEDGDMDMGDGEDHSEHDMDGDGEMDMGDEEHDMDGDSDMDMSDDAS